MIKKIATYPDPVLRKVATPIDVVDDEIRKLLSDMAETMYAGDGVGLAAPQVSVSLRVITIDVSPSQEGTPGLLKMANPEIVSGEGETEYEEGCLSVPELRVSIKRKEKVKVTYMDENGTKKELDCEGLLAIAAQHEIDHLNGDLIIDHTGRLKRDLYERRIKKHKKEISF